MNFTLRSTSNSSNDNERLTRNRQSTTLNRFLSFNENNSFSAESRRRLLQSTPNLIELLEDDEDDLDENQALCHECNTCSKVFASEYGLNHHISMHHPNQSILCALCNITFRSHRSLKTHQQRRHSTVQTKLNADQPPAPNYSYVSSYLVLAFSSQQFPLMAKSACEEQRLPLGCFSSKLYQCHRCSIAFPCSRTLNYHYLNQHEQYEYKTCQAVLSDVIMQVECASRTVDDDDDNDGDADEIESMKLLLAKQAVHLGLIDKQLAKTHRKVKIEQNQRIYPRCQHTNRTCANLCLEHLSSYSQLIKNYPYSITTIPKGNPCAQGSIVSVVSSANNIHSNGSSSTNDTNPAHEVSNGRQKRKSIKQSDGSSSPQLKKKTPTNVVTTITRTSRPSSTVRTAVGKQPVDSTTKANETKSISVDSSAYPVSLSTASAAQRRLLPKESYVRSSSISSNSSTSTRSSMTKSSSSANLTSQAAVLSHRTSKRHLSPAVFISLETSSQKRRRPRTQPPKLASSSSTAVIRIDDDDDVNDVEQENDDEEDNDDNDDIVPIKVEPSAKQRQSKQRQASSGSIEYVQTLNSDQPATPSLNNIENIKAKAQINDEEIIICRSPPSARKTIASPSKNHSKTIVNGNGARKSNGQQSPTNDEHVRVRCKICGDILEGRSRFSKHVLTMHSHLLEKNIPGSKQQQQQTAIVR